eukprot:COSAG02_NODE_479_length_21477_cov_49.737674_4_plen_184_part_00
MTGGTSQPSRRRPPLHLSRHFRSTRRSELIRNRRRRADGQRPHPVAAHRGRPGAAPRTSSRPTHLCAGIAAGVPDWWGAVGSALHMVSRCSSSNGPPPTASFFFSWLQKQIYAPGVTVRRNREQQLGLAHAIVLISFDKTRVQIILAIRPRVPPLSGRESKHANPPWRTRRNKAGVPWVFAYA